MSNKQEIRDRYINIRSSLSKSYLAECDKIVSRKVIFFIQRYKLKKIGIYGHANNIIDTRLVIEYCLDNGIEVYAPTFLNKGENLEFRKVTDYDQDFIDSGYCGFVHVNPDNKLLKKSTKLDALFMPVVAFDRHLNRISQGNALYDKWICDNNYQGYKIGLSQSTQLTNEMFQIEEHDIPMNFVITEKEVYVPMIDDEEAEMDYEITYWRLNDETIIED
ncbi:5-formyltetrahydrofolate cyclo-ligase [Mesoplasma photuris]|uniref:5-formyltetrahydrofolate cyclo-ligase n=1 Tax=Mesoplasma photuris TaxID=217731 RepID=UPI0004E24B60|nr:5-formyltetrahydrofolate cyclo-ligase [Mesoplasma photuris]